MPSTPPCVLRKEEQTRQRQCQDCDDRMQAVSCDFHDSPWLFHDRLLTFRCQSCGAQTQLLDGETFAMRVVMVLAMLGSFIALGLYGGFSEIWGLISDVSLWSLLGLFLAGFSVIVGLLMISASLELIEDIRRRKRHQRVQGCSGWVRFGNTLALGAVPWLLAGATGYYDYFVEDLSENIALLLLPVIVAPLFLAHRFGLSGLGVFLATLMWLPIVYWIFDLVG